MAAIENVAPNKVPFWAGTPSDPPADVWMAQVTKLRGINKWSENQTLDAIYLSLQGPAAKWYKALVQDETYSQIGTLPGHKVSCRGHQASGPNTPEE
jgi:hypothetical protein